MMSTVDRDPLGRAIRLLIWMVDHDHGEIGIREIAQFVGMSHSTVHRLLTSMAQHGLVVQKASGKYELGWELLRIARRTLPRFSLREVAHPLLLELSRESGETACLGIYDSVGHKMMFTVCVESPHPVRYVIPEDVWVPLHSGASGLAILAFLPDRERQRIIQHVGLQPITADTITDERELVCELERIRARGYAVTKGQRVAGAVGIAAPVFQSGDSVIGDVVLSMPEQRFDWGSEAALAGRVQQAAQRITQALRD